VNADGEENVKSLADEAVRMEKRMSNLWLMKQCGWRETPDAEEFLWVSGYVLTSFCCDQIFLFNSCFKPLNNKIFQMWLVPSVLSSFCYKYSYSFCYEIFLFFGFSIF
jgi:hypothetical protein